MASMSAQCSMEGLRLLVTTSAESRIQSISSTDLEHFQVEMSFEGSGIVSPSA